MKYLVAVNHLTIGRRGDVLTADQTRMTPDGLAQAVEIGMLVEVDDEGATVEHLGEDADLVADATALADMTKTELLELAADLDIQGRSTMTVGELRQNIAALRGG